MESVSILRAPISSSKLAQRKACPGSAHAEKDLPRVDNPYSEEGTALHYADAHPYEPRDKFTPQQREILERNESLRQQFLDRELPRLGIAPEAKVVKFAEREFVLCDSEGEPVISHGSKVPGHPDLIHWYPDYLIAIIFDSKFGRIEVDAAWMNLQLKSYFVMFCENFRPETVIVAITQPWAAKPNDFHSAEYSFKDLDAHRQELLDIIRATEPLNAPRYASISACTYCLAAGHCPIAITAATEMAVVKVNDLTPEQLENLWDEIRLAERVIEHYYKRLEYIASTFPQTLKQIELKETGSLRVVKKTSEAIIKLAETRLFDDNDIILNLCDLSIGRLEESVCNLKKINKKDANEWIEQTLGPLLELVKKQRSLVKKPVSIHQGKAA
jgi:hypothetical protein